MKNGLRFDPRAWMPDEHAPAGVEAVQSTPPSPVETRRAFPLPAPHAEKRAAHALLPVESRVHGDHGRDRSVLESGKGHGRTLGIVADGVSDVLDIARDEAKQTPDFGSRVSTVFISGLFTVNDNNMVMLLDIDRLFDLGDQYVLDDARVADS